MAELILKADPSQIESGMARGKQAVAGVGAEARKTESAIDKMAKGGGAASRRMASAFSAMQIAAKSAGVAAGAALTGFAAKGFASARDVDAALSEVATLIEGTAEQIEFIRSAAERMSGEFGGTMTQQIGAFYQAISAGSATVADAAVVLDAANRLAVGGVTDVKTAVDVLTSATNAYAAAGLSSASASDILFTGVKAGKTTVSELARTLGNVIPIASSVGVGFDQVVSAVAALTTQGQSTALAVTGVRAAMSAVLRPSSEAQKIAKALGIEFSAAALEAKGFGGFLEEVIAKTGGSQEAIAKLFGSVEALNAVLAFSGGAGEKFAATMDMMRQAAGATDDAFGKVADSTTGRLNQAFGKLGAEATRVGAVLLEAVVPAVEFMAENMKAVEVAIIAAGTALAVAFAPVTGIMIAAGGAIALVASAIGSAQDREGLTTAVYSAANATRALNEVLGVFNATQAPQAGQAAIELAQDNVTLAKSALDAAKAELAKAKAMEASADSLKDGKFTGMAGEFAAREAANMREDAQRDMEEARKMVEQAEADLARAARVVTGSGFGAKINTKVTVTPEEQELKDRVQKALDALGDTKAGGAVDSIKGAYDGLLSSLDPVAAASIRYAKAQKTVAEALKNGTISQEEANRTLALAKGAYEDAISGADKFQQSLSKIADTVANRIGDGFLDMVTGTKTVAEAFRSMASDIVRELYRVIVVQRIVGNVRKLIGGIGGFSVPAAPSYDGGGYTGAGARSGGIDGKGGFWAVMHPRETVVDHTKPGQSAAPSVTINQTFTGGVTRDDLNDAVPRIVAASKSAVLDAMRRHQGGF